MEVWKGHWARSEEVPNAEIRNLTCPFTAEVCGLLTAISQEKNFQDVSASGTGRVY